MAKITKQQLVEFIRRVGTLQVSAEVQSVIDYTVDAFNENPRNVTGEELKETVATIESATGRTFQELVLEATNNDKIAKGEEPIALPIKEVVKEDKKPNTKKESKKKVTPKKEKAVEKVENQEKKVIKPKAEKNVEVPTEPVKEEVKEEKAVEKKKAVKPTKKEAPEVLDTFPMEIKSESLKGTLKLRTDLATIKDVVEAFNNEVDIVIASYWTKRHLKQYGDSYDPMGINPNKPKSFENDLDLIEITYANELVVTGCSLYSFIPQIYLPRFFEQDEDGMRYANGCEFQIYEVVTEGNEETK